MKLFFPVKQLSTTSVWQGPFSVSSSQSVLVIPFSRAFLAFWAAFFFCFLSRRRSLSSLALSSASFFLRSASSASLFNLASLSLALMISILCSFCRSFLARFFSLQVPLPSIKSTSSF